MPGVTKKKAQQDSLPLFDDLPAPPAGAELMEFRSLRHPVWTELKAKLIARYLKLFTFVTHHGTYIDGFAGQQSKQAEMGWAAELVLADRPWRLRQFYLCDSDPKQIEEINALVARQPTRDKKKDSKREIEVIAGDFNVTVGRILSTRKLDPATFCLLDQRTFECKWSTVTALAHHRTTGPKIELFYFLPIGWLNRAILATTKNHAEINAWWGGENWQHLVDLNHVQKALAFQRRFVELDYKFAHAFPIFDRENGDRVMFYMILVSDHPAAPKLMWRAYDQAVHDTPDWDQLSLIA